MSQFNGDLGSWAVSNYDIPDAFDLLIPPAVTQAPTSTPSFPPIEAHPQTHSLPTSGRMSEASVQIESGHPTARSADSASSDEGPASGSETVKSKRTGTSRYTTELKLAKNREAQRRFRLKQKARSTDIQAQLANTAAKVQELKQQKHQLEASNVLLRQSSNFLQAGQAPSLNTEATTAHSPWAESARAFPSKRQDVPQAQLAAAWTDHIHQMGSCLLQMDGHEDPSVHTTLQRLTSEAMTLVAQLVRTHGKVSGPIMHNGKTPGMDEHMHPQPNDAFYARILSNLHLSEDQAKDLLFLRRLFLTRRCVLSMERKSLINQLTATDHEVLNPTDNIFQVEHLTNTLKENAAEDHELYYKVARAMFRGVLSTRQVAEMMVHAYPFVNVHEALLESLAAHGKELTKDEIVAAAVTNRMAADYAQLLQYCEVVGASAYSGHLPIWTCCPGAKSS